MDPSKKALFGSPHRMATNGPQDMLFLYQNPVFVEAEMIEADSFPEGPFGSSHRMGENGARTTPR